MELKVIEFLKSGWATPIAFILGMVFNRLMMWLGEVA